MKPKTLFIGLGNILRGDDGIGWILTDQLLVKGYKCVQHRDDFTLMLDDFKTHDSVVIIDAMYDQARAIGDYDLFDLKNLNEIHYGSSTHSLSLRQTFEIALIMGCLPKRLKVYAINGRNFAMGQGLSHEMDLDFHLKNLEELCTNPA